MRDCRIAIATTAKPFAKKAARAMRAKGVA
jgi:hypothetical protein